MAENWRDVPGYEGLYQVSDHGRVRNRKRLLKPHTGKRKADYPRIQLRSSKGPRRFMVHRLVAAAFIGPALGREVNHKNGRKNDPSLPNLEYVTTSENHLHAYRELGKPKPTGSRHGMHKLVEPKVLEIIGRIESGETIKTIADHFGVSCGTISMIAMGRTWRHLPRKPQEDRRKAYGKLGSNWDATASLATRFQKTHSGRPPG